MKFEENAITMEDDKAVVFERISMINHSCVPNVEWFTEVENESRAEVRVCRKI